MCEADSIARFVNAAVAKGHFADRREDARLHASMEVAFLEVNETDAGRRAFKALLHHASCEVRQWVASQLLSEGDESAIAVLEELAKRQGLQGFSAQMTLS